MPATLRRPNIRTILAPSDLSAASVTSVTEAATLARRFGAELIVVAPIPRPRTNDHPQYLDQIMDTARMRLAAWFVQHVPADARQGLPVRFLAVTGAPANVVLAAAEAEAVDLIVIAERPRSGLSRLIHRSVAEAIVRATPRPVLTIRTDGVPARAPAAA